MKVYAENVRELSPAVPNADFFKFHNDLVVAAQSDSKHQASAQMDLLALYDSYRKFANYEGICALVTVPEDEKVLMLEFGGVPKGSAYQAFYDEVKQRHYIEVA